MVLLTQASDWAQLYLAALNAFQTIALAVIAALSHKHREERKTVRRRRPSPKRRRTD